VLSRAYAFAAGRLKHRDVELGVNDNGFFIAAEELDEKKIISFVKSKDLKLIIKEALVKTDVLKRRFRHCAGRSLMILRNYKGRNKSVGKQQVHSEFLFAAVRKIGDSFPILQEARREVLEDLMDLKNATKVIEAIEKGQIKIKHIRTPIVSPFGLGVWMHGKSDLIKIEDRVAFLKRMHALHLKAIGEKNDRNSI
jgi:ATP-dependent Lhr-like helicase